MPAKPTRSLSFRLRLSPAEKATLEERAQAAGLAVAEYLRREAGVGKFGRADLRAAGAKVGVAAIPSTIERGSDYEQRVHKMAFKMPRKTAEAVVRREEAREQAKAERS